MDRVPREWPSERTKWIAQVAAVYTLAPYVRGIEDVIAELRPPDAPVPVPPRPEGKRVWAGLVTTPTEVIEHAFLDASSRDRPREKRWVVLVDGNVDQLARVKAACVFFPNAPPRPPHLRVLKKTR